MSLTVTVKLPDGKEVFFRQGPTYWVMDEKKETGRGFHVPDTMVGQALRKLAAGHSPKEVHDEVLNKLQEAINGLSTQVDGILKGI